MTCVSCVTVAYDCITCCTFPMHYYTATNLPSVLGQQVCFRCHPHFPYHTFTTCDRRPPGRSCTWVTPVRRHTCHTCHACYCTPELLTAHKPHETHSSHAGHALTCHACDMHSLQESNPPYSTIRNTPDARFRWDPVQAPSLPSRCWPSYTRSL